MSIKKDEIERRIHGFIPLSKLMGARVHTLSDRECVLHVPLAGNHNHKGTAFGGAIYSACTLSCYALVYSLQTREALENWDLVIAAGSIRYLRPIDSDFSVKVELDPVKWDGLAERLKSGRSGKLELSAEVHLSVTEILAAEFKGEFGFVR